MVYDIRKKKRMKASDVITAVIRYLKDDLLNTLNQRLRNVDDSMVMWILTVPVSWTVLTLGFITTAAIMVIMNRN